MTTLDRRIDAVTLERLLAEDADVRVLDVRTPAEFESAHIPGAYNVPLDTLGEHAAELERHLSEPVMLVCKSGTRANQACEKLAATGMANLHVLDGGMQSWDDGRRPVRRGRQRWDLERQVRLVAGSLVLAGIAGSVFVPGLKYVSGFVGAGLAFAAVTNTCAMGMALSKLPYNRDAGCDVEGVVRELTAASRS
ncbi:MAG TPA: rhodanese-like domain-containing protein [Acidimicrobiales bacterium]|nr:rhodanese-like domain-containing protein [Acidimicrobiales bacterium]